MLHLINLSRASKPGCGCGCIVLFIGVVIMTAFLAEWIGLALFHVVSSMLLRAG